jgi:type I restriction-modification system DNA methylase subunit
MPLFQTTVEKSYLKAQDKNIIAKQFKKFTKYFHNTDKQENIRRSKEEQFQEGFLRELFVNILGYTINPDNNFNLTTEFKNHSNAQKADGAILSDGKAVAVIELKGTKTRDLEKVRKQAFDYKANQPDCVYVITSNFERLRFYIDNAVEYIEFNLFTLTQDEFALLWLCLSKDNLLNNLPQKIKNESIVNEKKITNRLYKDYSEFKRKLFRDLVKGNMNNDVFRSELASEDSDRASKNIKLTLFKKSQKLIDRFLFIFFAEDRGLIPNNTTIEILSQWDKLRDEFDIDEPLYNRFKKYFNYLDTGRKASKTSKEIFAYNGGLFKTDSVLDSLLIDDELLYTHAKALSEYDFDSQVGVNVLGHIFENSLNEIESINAEIEGVDFDKQKSKRKKDGVFYTPQYITRYIVESTVGKLCTDKKATLDIVEEEYYKGRKGRQAKTIVSLNEKLESYRNWLLELTILDPACGSGAFLNEAMEFLIKEHRWIDELHAALYGDALVLSNIENTILEKNIFGVDLNEESVEIAKLSLWLRSAAPRRKLNDLSSNIKCGNSLISVKAVAGEKAFVWEEEFSAIFEKGGFDVVIGNPPYVRAELLGDYRDYFEKKYDVFHSASDLFAYFYELGSKLIKEDGVMAYISNTFDKTAAGQVLREHLTKKVTFNTYVDFTEVQIFEGATTYPVIISLDRREPTKKSQFEYIKIPKSSQGIFIDIIAHPVKKVEQLSLSSDSWAFLSVEQVKMFNNMKALPTVRDIYGKSYRGLITGLNDAFIVQNDMALSEHIKEVYEGKDIKKWNTPVPTQKLITFKSKWTKEVFGSDITEEEAIEKLTSEFPEIMEHLLPFEERGKKRYDKGEFWWELRNCAYYDLFDKPKIIFPNLQNANKFCLDSKGVFINAPAVFLPTDNKTLLCILNSKIVWEYLKSICVVRSGGYIEVKPQYFEQIPVPELKNEEEFEAKADAIIDNTAKLQDIVSKFTTYLLTQHPTTTLPRKLQNWHTLSFADFIKELNKVIKKEGGEKLTKLVEMDWQEAFEAKKSEAVAVKDEIEKIDSEIDEMVFDLYGLSSGEIEIVRGEK